MNAIQQYMLDLYRAARTDTAPPPHPGDHDLRTLRETRGHRRLRAVPASRRAVPRPADAHRSPC
ncbi:hypothetical protein ACWGH4_05940 [Streptomyces sp. NPDC054847]